MQRASGKHQTREVGDSMEIRPYVLAMGAIGNEIAKTVPKNEYGAEGIVS